MRDGSMLDGMCLQRCKLDASLVPILHSIVGAATQWIPMYASFFAQKSRARTPTCPTPWYPMLDDSLGDCMTN